MQGNFSVQIADFATRHFIKNFEKKYKAHWHVTLRAIIAELARIDALLQTDRAETERITLREIKDENKEDLKPEEILVIEPVAKAWIGTNELSMLLLKESWL